MKAVTYDKKEMARMVAKIEGRTDTIDMYDYALCFRLQFKHHIMLKYTKPSPGRGILYYADWSDYCTTPNEAIFLAIIDNYNRGRKEVLTL